MILLWLSGWKKLCQKSIRNELKPLWLQVWFQQLLPLYCAIHWTQWEGKCKWRVHLIWQFLMPSQVTNSKRSSISVSLFVTSYGICQTVFVFLSLMSPQKEWEIINFICNFKLSSEELHSDLQFKMFKTTGIALSKEKSKKLNVNVINKC